MSRYYNEKVRQAQRRYQEKCRSWTVRFNKDKWFDVVEWLEDTANVTEYIGQLVREDMQRYK